jgi:hypothetical protein
MKMIDRRQNSSLSPPLAGPAGGPLGGRRDTGRRIREALEKLGPNLLPITTAGRVCASESLSIRSAKIKQALGDSDVYDFAMFTQPRRHRVTFRGVARTLWVDGNPGEGLALIDANGPHSSRRFVRDSKPPVCRSLISTNAFPATVALV